MTRPEPGTNLPAPYRSPWRALGDDLRAVLATLRLGLQEVWRRNAEGDLPRPALWPRDLAPLFWPGLLALLLTALGLLGLGTLRGWGRGPAPVPPPMERAPAGTAAPAEDQASARAESGSAEVLGPAPVESVAGSDPSPEEQPGRSSGAPEDPQAQRQEAPITDPLAALVADPAAEGLLRSARGEPARASLELVLADGFLGLSGAEQQRRADHWQQLALGLGYEHLQLRDARGALVAREAVVGGGMILLIPPERS